MTALVAASMVEELALFVVLKLLPILLREALKFCAVSLAKSGMHRVHFELVPCVYIILAK